MHHYDRDWPEKTHTHTYIHVRLKKLKGLSVSWSCINVFAPSVEVCREHHEEGPPRLQRPCRPGNPAVTMTSKALRACPKCIEWKPMTCESEKIQQACHMQSLNVTFIFFRSLLCFCKHKRRTLYTEFIWHPMSRWLVGLTSCLGIKVQGFCKTFNAARSADRRSCAEPRPVWMRARP